MKFVVGLLLLAGGARAEDAGVEAPMMQVESFDAPVDAGSSMLIESFEPVDAGPALETVAEPAPSGPTVQLHGDVMAQGAVDTRFESPPGAQLAENVAEGRLRARLSADIKLSDRVRVFIEGRAHVRLATQRDFDRAKGSFEPLLGEAFVDLYTSKVDFRIGAQRIPLGANASLAPADALNPRDLRFSPLSTDGDDVSIPVFAVRAQGELGKVQWLAAYVPFFAPSRFVIFGQDEAVAQPALAEGLETRRVDASIEDVLQDRLFETKRPAVFLGDFALKAVSMGRFKVGASWAWINEKTPQVTVDPELALLLKNQSSGKKTDPALAASVQSRLTNNETLLTGQYLRQHVFSLQGSTLLGPTQIDLDFSFSPRATFVDQNLNPLNKPSLTWVAGISQAEDSPLFYALVYLGQSIPEVKKTEQLILIEPSTALGADRVAFFHQFLAALGYSFFDKRLEVQMAAYFEPIQKSFALAPKVTWSGFDRWKLWLGAEFFEGPQYSVLGYFGRNDKVYVGAQYQVFQ